MNENHFYFLVNFNGSFCSLSPPPDRMQLQTLLSPTCLSPVNLPSFFTPAVLASPLHQVQTPHLRLCIPLPFSLSKHHSRVSFCKSGLCFIMFHDLRNHFGSVECLLPCPQASPNQKVREMTRWLQRAYQELLEAWTSAEGRGYAEKYQVRC